MATFPDAHLKAKDLERFVVVVIEKEGRKIELSGTEIERPAAITFLLSQWDRVCKAYHSLDKVDAPFHSDVFQALKDEFESIQI